METKSDKQLAQLALILDDEKPNGEKPSLLEIDLWRRGKLKKKRSAEVQSYIARDAECYRQWTELVSDAEQLKSEKTQIQQSWQIRLQNWWAKPHTIWLGGGLALVTASLLITVVTLKTVMQADDLLTRINSDYAKYSGQAQATQWYLADNTKSLDFHVPTQYDLLKPAIDYGIQSGLAQLLETGMLDKQGRWSELQTVLPQALPTCPAEIQADDCVQQQTLLTEFGRNLVLVQLHCADKTASESQQFYQQQQLRMGEFNKEFSRYDVFMPLREQLSAWQFVTEKPAFCQQLKSLMSRL